MGSSQSSQSAEEIVFDLDNKKVGIAPACCSITQCSERHCSVVLGVSKQ